MQIDLIDPEFRKEYNRRLLGSPAASELNTGYKQVTPTELTQTFDI